jgi:uncharacterized protein (TIGR02611 family)
MSAEPERPELIENLLARREHHRRRHPLYRAAFAAVGALVLAAGLVMLVTPGPAFVLIPAGLAMLAMEFRWAERLLERALRQAEAARRRARGTSRLQRVLGASAGAVATAGVAAAAFAWGPL